MGFYILHFFDTLDDEKKGGAEERELVRTLDEALAEILTRIRLYKYVAIKRIENDRLVETLVIGMDKAAYIMDEIEQDWRENEQCKDANKKEKKQE